MKNWLRSNGISVVQAAEDLGITKAQIHKIFTGGSSLRKPVALAFQAVYGVSAEWLLTGEGDKSSIKDNMINESAADLREAQEQIKALKKSLAIMAIDAAKQGQISAELDDEERNHGSSPAGQPQTS